MCGIAGVIGPQRPAAVRVSRTLDQMHHRGPDARGAWSGPVGAHTVTLLHTRLSIVDLDPRAHQPWVHETAEGQLALAFNGEIYNHIELRTQLKGLGFGFETTSDTEVVVKAWLAWGPEALDRFEGMWAFALYDGRDGTVTLSRDRFGEKPLYWMHHEGALYFASEVKALAQLSGHKPEVDTDQLRRYLVLGYKSLYKRPRTFFTGVHALPAAHTATLSGPGDVAPQPYWRLEYRPVGMSYAAAVEGARARVFEAVKLRLRADVPVAFCLSGGIDSGTLASVASKHFGHDVTAFSILDGDPRYDETENVMAVVNSLGLEHHVIRPERRDFLSHLRRRTAQHDAPVVTLNYYMASFMLETIADAGFKVALSGTGADELFTGYYDHYAFWLAQMSSKPGFEQRVADWRQSYGAFVRNPLLQDPLGFVKHPDARGHIYLNAEQFSGYMRAPVTEAFEETRYSDDLLRNRMLNELGHEAVPVILYEEDLNAMATSVENRAPYLDRNLAEFMFSVPPEHLIHDGHAKWLLRAAGEGLLVDSVRLDKRKRGFNLALDSVLDRWDPETRAAILDDGPIFDIVRRDAIAEVLGRETLPNSFSKFLFSFVSTRLFLETWAELDVG
ncbi:MAG: asparagine synthase (glutamine-hydrolyzing) [Bradymonadia bacterium]